MPFIVIPALYLVSAIHRTIHHVLRAATSVMEKQVNRTLIRLQFQDRPDAIFQLEGFLEGEDLHRRIDVLLDEHLDDTIVPILEVVTIDGNGKVAEEAIPLYVY